MPATCARSRRLRPTCACWPRGCERLTAGPAAGSAATWPACRGRAATGLRRRSPRWTVANRCTSRGEPVVGHRLHARLADGGPVGHDLLLNLLLPAAVA